MATPRRPLYTAIRNEMLYMELVRRQKKDSAAVKPAPVELKKPVLFLKPEHDK